MEGNYILEYCHSQKCFHFNDYRSHSESENERHGWFTIASGYKEIAYTLFTVMVYEYMHEFKIVPTVEQVRKMWGVYENYATRLKLD